MSYSVSWQEGVSTDAVEQDLALEKATVSPPLENMGDDVKATVEAARDAAISIVATLPKGTYKVSAYGHVRQHDADLSTSNLQIAEYVPEPAE